MLHPSNLPVVAAIAAMLAPLRCAGHGYLVEPPARNAVDRSGTGSCPHCGNGNGVCGDGNQWPSDNFYVRAVQQPHRTYEAGSIVQFEVSMNVNHKGHHEFFICDRAISSDSGAVECLQKWPLMRVPPEELHGDCKPDDAREDCQPIDPNFPGRWYHPPGMTVHKIHYRIPQDLICEHCTLQWFWPTANSAAYDPVSYSCYQRRLRQLGWTVFDFCGWACSDGRCPSDYKPPANRAPDPQVGSGFEEFRNCADIRITVAGAAPSTAPPPTPTPVTTAKATTTSTSPAPPVVTTTQASSVPATTMAPTSCVPIGDCSAQAWCRQAAYAAWCVEQATAGVCPQPFCHDASDAEPESEPESEAEPESEPETEPESEPETEPEAESEGEPESESKPEAEAESEPEAEAESEPEAEAKAEHLLFVQRSAVPASAALRSTAAARLRRHRSWGNPSPVLMQTRVGLFSAEVCIRDEI